VTSLYREARVFTSVMSSIFGQGSGSKSNDMFADILKQLSAMDEHL
jgi:hypothetical protein